MIPILHNQASPQIHMMWIGGILELSSKVRYGISSRGLPIFRFIPYERSLGPFAVSCSQRSLFYNVHAIVEPHPQPQPQTQSTLPRASLIQLLGPPTQQSETSILLSTYAYDNKKELRKFPKELDAGLYQNIAREQITGFTFNIDPPGCRDVDDTFTFNKIQDGWIISINIADVSAFVQEGSALDEFIKQKATSFYSPTGESLAPMLPPYIEEAASLLPGKDKLTISLQFYYDMNSQMMSGFRWIPSVTNTTTSYTYDQAKTTDPLRDNHGKATDRPEFQVLAEIAGSLDSHKWVEKMMILYNTKAAETLKQKGQGILRSHTQPQREKLAQWTAISPELAFMAYDSAKFVDANQEAFHYGLNTVYANASSPIRRYCDLVNQRVLKGLTSRIDPTLTQFLNQRQKQAKAFSRDLFFMTELKGSEVATGTVISVHDVYFKVYVPAWKRVVKVKTLSKGQTAVKTEVSLTWYDDMKSPNWKERIVFAFRNIK